MHAETAPVHITRYHDLSTHGRQGAFIDAVASISQFIAGDSTFYTRNDNDLVEVVCVVSVCMSSTVDGTPLFSLDKNYTTVGLIDGVNYYAMSVIIPKKGFHLIQSGTDGTYAYYVVGQDQKAMYGYIGGINRYDKSPQRARNVPNTAYPLGKHGRHTMKTIDQEQILAGVTCAGSYKACDHAAFMPQPLPTPTCYQNPTLDDNHPAYTSITNGFYVDIPSACKDTQQLKVFGNRGAMSKNFPLSPTKQTPLLSFDSSFGLAVNMHAE
ncbi:hypothetical protein ANCDUO_13667 [Ancylostoma duodenale]|uniref:Uncharacterized protein n=1 Tax=Ancylostoma duodenale TaxID=51022 RepID=A0A0C2GGC4_9BILA|nr:hypothetical protein ANCDUO_13667 [Ancylostoma duodenale]